jgi:hypothetical protein
VQVIVYNDPKRSFNAAGRARATGRRNAGTVGETPWQSLDGDAEMLIGTDDNLCLGSETELKFSAVATLDTLAIDLEKKPGAYQMLVREVRVWGMPESLSQSGTLGGAPVACTASANTYSSIRVNYGVPVGTRYVRVSYRAKGAANWSRACFSSSPGLILWVRPDTEYEVFAEAVGPGLRTGPHAIRTVRLPHPLEMRTMGDAFGMNFYPGGGGAHQAQPDEDANTRAMVKLLEDAGVRHVRWWVPSPGAAELFAEHGMSLLPSATYTRPEDYERLTRTTGAWMTQTTNEPDFANIFAEDYVKEFIPRHAAAKRFSPLMTIVGPAIGGEMVGPGADYLQACYAAGLKDAVDGVDLHPYAKTSTPIARGGTAGGPEGLLYSLAASREAMRKVGDAQRPVIASESGHPTYEGEWFMPASSYEQQAKWIVRTHLLLIASGLRRIIWYAFEDEGTDKRNAEHCFGIVDWYGKPKPAYQSYRTMTRLLGDAHCEGLEPKLSAPVYAVRCRAADAGYITAIWDSDGVSEVRLRADAGVSSVVALMGEKLPAPEKSGEATALTVDGSVRYVFSTRPLMFLSQKRVSSPVEPQVQVALSPASVEVRAGQPCEWTVRMASEFPCEVKVTLNCGNPLGPKQATEAVMRFDAPAQVKRGIISWDTRCQYVPVDQRFHAVDTRRAQFFLVPNGEK